MGHKKLVTSDPSKDYPNFLKTLKSRIPFSRQATPAIFSFEASHDQDKVRELIERGVITRVTDNYAEQYAELLLSRNAHLYRANHSVQVNSIAELLKAHYGTSQSWEVGRWVYYPWSGELVHVLDQKDFEDLRTIRNRDLITAREQKKLLEFEVACFGMSVGSASAQALAITGISRKIKLIDGAVISGSNLNRILTGVASVGKGKSQVIAEQIYQMNPYSQVKTYDKATENNLASIFDSPWPIKLAIDEIDDIEMKVRIRAEARQRRIPVLMATEIGDTVILDVERYDLEPHRAFFHGMVPGIEDLLVREIGDYREWTKHAVKIIDPSNMSIKMQKSLLKIGTTIVTHPQLGATVMMTGGVLAFAVKNIALGNSLNSGRYVISLERQLLAKHKTRNYKRKHRKHTKIINKAVDSM
jgi:hypothetical protein